MSDSGELGEPLDPGEPLDYRGRPLGGWKYVNQDAQYGNLREMWDLRWTVVDDELIEMLELAMSEVGSWKQYGIATGIKARQIYRYRYGELKTMSFRVADQLFSRSMQMMKLLDREWITVEELQKRGIWHAQWGRYDKSDPGTMLPMGKTLKDMQEGT